MPSATRSRAPWPWIVIGIALGAGLALVVFVREPGETLTGESLEAAQRRWRDAGVSGYLMAVDTSGATEARHRIEVRDGEVVSMTIGEAEATRSAWRHWTVEGLFAFLDTELANAGDPRRAYGVEPGQVVLRARFHPQLGYPEFFLRHVMGRRQSVEWRVASFERR